MFENKLINGIHVSRYIASWAKVGGTFNRGRIYDFHDWLLSLGLTEEDARYVRNFAGNGKLELEGHARQFIKTLPPIEE